MSPPTLAPVACCDCVQLHGDDPAAWLNQWPKGAEYRDRFRAHLCDGCADDREALFHVEPDAYDLPPYADEPEGMPLSCHCESYGGGWLFPDR